MTWNQDGGGDRKNPWGQGPQGPNDIEDAIRQSRDRFKKAMPGGFGESKGIFSLLVILFAVWVMSGFYYVNEGEEALILRLGKFQEVNGAGLHYHLPYPIETKIQKDVETIINFRSPMSLMLTGDENIVHAGFTIQYHIKDLERYLLRARSPDETVRVAATSMVREVMAQSSAHEAISTRRDLIAKTVKQQLQTLVDEYDLGINIVRVDMQRVDPPETVRDAYLDVQRALTDKESLINEAEAYKNKVLQEAEGQAARIRETAEAYKAERVEKAKGEAGQFDKVYQSYKESPNVTKKRIYLETMQDVLADSNKIIVDKGNGFLPHAAIPALNSKKEG